MGQKLNLVSNFVLTFFVKKNMVLVGLLNTFIWLHWVLIAVHGILVTACRFFTVAQGSSSGKAR